MVLKGHENLQDQEILGVLGVNLVYGARYLHHDAELLLIHSHAVLESIRSGRPGREDMVPETVAELIREQQLFRCA